MYYFVITCKHAIRKTMGPIKEINGNLKEPRNFDISFPVTFICNDQSLVSGRMPGHQLGSVSNQPRDFPNIP